MSELGSDRRMPFLDHLVELRTRLLHSVVAVAIATVFTYLFKESLFALMVRPLTVAWSAMQAEARLPPLEIVFTSLVDGFMVLLKLSLLAAVFLASPVIFYQLWRFISPGLYPRERRLALPFILASVVLFVGGALFAYLFVLPAGYGYFLSYSSHSMGFIQGALGARFNVRLTDSFALRPMITMDEYFGLTGSLLLLFGVVFELPLLLSILALLGIVTPRTLWRFNRYAILIFFVLGAVLTPGDLVVGQLAMGGALTVLYNLSILIAVLFARRRAKATASMAAAPGSTS